MRVIFSILVGTRIGAGSNRTEGFGLLGMLLERQLELSATEMINI